MKPGDHPEFFRFPAPEGRSRESDIVLDGSGRFWHEGAPIEKPAMRRAFASWIGLHPDDGRFILSNDYDWTYFTVEDVPFFVESLRLNEDCSAAQLVLSDGSVEDFHPSALRIGSQGALYCRVKGGAFDGRFTQSAQLSLEPLLSEADDGALSLRLGQELFPIDLQSSLPSAKKGA